MLVLLHLPIHQLEALLSLGSLLEQRNKSPDPRHLLKALYRQPFPRLWLHNLRTLAIQLLALYQLLNRRLCLLIPNVNRRLLLLRQQV